MGHSKGKQTRNHVWGYKGTQKTKAGQVLKVKNLDKQRRNRKARVDTSHLSNRQWRFSRWLFKVKYHLQSGEGNIYQDPDSTESP